MTAKAYKLTTMGDLLTIPPDRLEECLNDLLFGIELMRFANPNAVPDDLPYMVWTDDGNHIVNLNNLEGKTMLTLDFTDKDNT
jgi:hypothetical protein